MSRVALLPLLLVACAGRSPAVEVGCLADPELEAYAIAFEGSGLSDWDGHAAVLRATMPMAFAAGRSCASRASVAIEGGGFSLVVEGRTDGAAYPTVGVFVDLDGDGACDAATEPAWSQIVAVGPGGELPVAIGLADLEIASDGSRCGAF
jgi:hypothetical protein